MSERDADVIIIGGGMAGLCCARVLHDAGLSFTLLEASDDIGGRMRSDVVDYFTLDRGFQVYLTSYPETARFIDVSQLTLNRFEPGAMIWFDDAFHRVDDARRRPERALAMAFSPVGSFSDKLNLCSTVLDVRKGEPIDLLRRPQTSTLEALRNRGFSDAMIERFFRPFYCGVFLERELATSSRLFEFTLRMFAEGDAVIPTGGMIAIPRHVASKLPERSIRLNTPVASIDAARTTVTLRDGSTLGARAIVVATDGRTAHQLLDARVPKPSFNGTACLYFVADEAPIKEPMLVLNGQGQGLVNNLCVPTRIAPSYGPPGAHLVSVSTVGVPEMSDESLVALVRVELSEWFGTGALDWRHLRTYRIPEALPEMLPRTLTSEIRQTRLSKGLYVAGDHVATASTNGAMRSGRLTAEALLADLS